VDQSITMIEIANNKVGLLDADRIKFDFGNATKLGYKDESFDLVITSNAPIYLAKATGVLRHCGEIIVAYSFGRNAFQNTKNEIGSLLNENKLSLINLNNVGKGAFIHG